MKSEVLVYNPWQENTVVLYDESGEAAVIDCGCFPEAEKQHFRNFMHSKGLTPVVYLNTHLHIDHVFGNAFMLEGYGLASHAHRADLFWVENAEQYAGMLGVTGLTPPPLPEFFPEDGDEIRFGHSLLKVIHVPGHSPGSLCYYSEAGRLLVAGDVLFEGSIGRTDLPGGNHHQLLEGIRQKLFVLPEEVRVIPGHGDHTFIGTEKRSNPFFRS